MPATVDIRTHATPAKENWPAPESSGAGHVTPNHAPHQSVDRNPFALSLSKGLTQASSRPKSPQRLQKASPPRNPVIPVFTRKREPGVSRNPVGWGTSRPPTPSGNRIPPPSLRRRGRSRTARQTTPRQYPPHPATLSLRRQENPEEPYRLCNSPSSPFDGRGSRCCPCARLHGAKVLCCGKAVARFLRVCQGVVSGLIDTYLGPLLAYHRLPMYPCYPPSAE